MSVDCKAYKQRHRSYGDIAYGNTPINVWPHYPPPARYLGILRGIDLEIAPQGRKFGISPYIAWRRRLCHVAILVQYKMESLTPTSTVMVLVRLGQRRRPLTYKPDESEGHSTLRESIKRLYSDVILQGEQFSLQIKDEQWDGEFVDLDVQASVPD